MIISELLKVNVDILSIVKREEIEFGAEVLLASSVVARGKPFSKVVPHREGVRYPLDVAFGDRREGCTNDGRSGAGSLVVSFHILSILTIQSSILDADIGSIPVDVCGAVRRRLRSIDDLPTTIGDHLDLNGTGPDEIVGFVKAGAPKAAIRILGG